MNEDTSLIQRAAQAMFTPPAEAQAEQPGSQAEVAEPQTAPAASEGQAEIAATQPAPEAATEIPAEAAVAEEAKPATPTEPYNYWADLAAKTEGLVKDEETFNGILEKSKNYETLAAEKAELEKNQWKPANDYVKQFNDLILGGAKADQIKAFVKLNEYGNLDELQPLEAKVAKMVLIDGYSEEVARKAVNRNFNFDQFDETDPDQKDDADILREELRISAKNDLEALKGYRKDLSVVPNPEKESAEQAQLQQIAQISTYNKTVEAEAPKMAASFPKKFDFDLKVGEESIPYELKMPPEFLEKEAPSLYAGYFKDSLDPLNKETVNEAHVYVGQQYVWQNLGAILEDATAKGYALGQEKTVNKYENRSGLPKAQENTLVAANEDGVNDFIRTRLLGKK